MLDSEVWIFGSESTYRRKAWAALTLSSQWCDGNYRAYFQVYKLRETVDEVYAWTNWKIVISHNLVVYESTCQRQFVKLETPKLCVVDAVVTLSDGNITGRKVLQNMGTETGHNVSEEFRAVGCRHVEAIWAAEQMTEEARTKRRMQKRERDYMKLKIQDWYVAGILQCTVRQKVLQVFVSNLFPKTFCLHWNLVQILNCLHCFVKVLCKSVGIF